MHKWQPKKYYFVFVLIRLTSLVSMDKIQKKCCFRTRPVGLISTKTKEYFVRRHLCIRSTPFDYLLILWVTNNTHTMEYFQPGRHFGTAGKVAMATL